MSLESVKRVAMGVWLGLCLVMILMTTWSATS